MVSMKCTVCRATPSARSAARRCLEAVQPLAPMPRQPTEPILATVVTTLGEEPCLKGPHSVIVCTEACFWQPG